MEDKKDMSRENQKSPIDFFNQVPTKAQKVLRTGLAALGIGLGASTILPPKADAFSSYSPSTSTTLTIDQAPSQKINLNVVDNTQAAFERQETLPIDYDLPKSPGIPNGHFYRETNGMGSDPATNTDPKGFLITDVEQAPAWTIVQELGGVATFGYPVAGMYFDNVGRLNVPLQRAILQLHKDSQGNTVVEYRNVFDELAAAGISLDNPTDLVPGSFGWSSDAGKSWGSTATGGLPGTIEENHIQGVFEGSVAKEIDKQIPGALKALKDYFLSNPNWLNMYGLPMSIKYYPDQDVVVVRAQRGALQYWIKQMAWTTKPGEVTTVLAGDVAKTHKLIPSGPMEPQYDPYGTGGGETQNISFERMYDSPNKIIHIENPSTGQKGFKPYSTDAFLIIENYLKGYGVEHLNIVPDPSLPSYDKQVTQTNITKGYNIYGGTPVYDDSFEQPPAGWDGKLLMVTHTSFDHSTKTITITYNFPSNTPPTAYLRRSLPGIGVDGLIENSVYDYVFGYLPVTSNGNEYLSRINSISSLTPQQLIAIIIP